MYTLLISIHIFVSALLILIVLIQTGRSGGISGLMGGGGSESLFSTSGQQSGIRKATVIIAVIFMFSSLGLTILSSRKSGSSVIQKRMAPLPVSEPVNDVEAE